MKRGRVDILLSVYNPNLDYLKKQLISINQQTYTNIKIYVFDDCVDKRTDPLIFKEYITNFSYELLPYEEKNLNYILAFGKLLEASKGEYIAFCDQDDIWMPNKIEKCVQYLNDTDTLLVASDRQIIDGKDNIIRDSVRKYNHKNYDSWQTYDDIAKYNIFVTYAVGMSIVARGDFARSTLPLSGVTAHDTWLLSCASTEGKVAFLNEALVQYRRHGNNVSGILPNINSKQDYVQKRVENSIRKIEDLERKYPNHKDLEEIKDFAYARKNKNIRKLIKYRYLAPDLVKFEIVMKFIPNFLFKFLLSFARR
ncbi:glycosyltransferase involved in cell wall biosynthesis [Breznakia sp. PF5-3]|uniref:glycosyltransferase n=1 Tax=unclassified Breznakia TaxID=2623764 RepID=UPI00240732FD|nr:MULTISPECIES: glycosyltransferase [unclassified Breznakia]MDF9824994.1 glycosyltransferase involved in cell wall biosynthesis [Breznakia sp. PM6-1]MDF9835813.1 glycosyltransferase involved in cell wall biosynthesis [Breznakia sp. PF5-3]MDF9836935.1 glycosyltransferase involved in cell wall biosynthesis [Breznakia sp. PFB2-8]MDF9859881.1 glycosyltransferase involved in cell wall biosynthesis [Breznakia sp. PH5-24]